MSFKYKWKKGTAPNRDEAAQNKHVLDESQFENERDQKLAEETARKHLGVPAPTIDEERPVLPTAIDSNKD